MVVFDIWEPSSRSKHVETCLHAGSFFFSRYSLFIQKIHKRPEDRFCVHGGVAPFGGAFHLHQLLVHLLHTVLDHWFETGRWKTKKSFTMKCHHAFEVGKDTQTGGSTGSPLPILLDYHKGVKSTVVFYSS